MKSMIKLSAIALVLLAAPLARAWQYNDGDALLIFRENGFNDVEFDLGSVSQFTSLASGTTLVVNKWDLNLVTNTFVQDLTGLTGVSVIVAASSSPSGSSWLSGSSPNAIQYDVTSSGQAQLYSIISAIGKNPVIYEAASNYPAAYALDPSSKPSYDFTVSGGTFNNIPYLGGYAAFDVEGVVPTSFGFWQIAPNSGATATYVGTFAIDASGNLTFTAGPPAGTVVPPTITGIIRAGTLDTVSFTTTSGGNYYLLYSNSLQNGASAGWAEVSGPVSGNGSTQSLAHTTTDTAGFYRVERTP